MALELNRAPRRAALSMLCLDSPRPPARSLAHRPHSPSPPLLAKHTARSARRFITSRPCLHRQPPSNEVNLGDPEEVWWRCEEEWRSGGGVEEEWRRRSGGGARRSAAITGVYREGHSGLAWLGRIPLFFQLGYLEYPGHCAEPSRTHTHKHTHTSGNSHTPP